MSNDAESEAPRAEARGIFVEPSDLSAEAIRAKEEAKNSIPPFGNPQGCPAKEGEVVHLKAGEHLPAVPSPSPTIEILKQLLEQMLENERRRLRNEYVRITMLFLVLLAVVLGSGLWFAHSLLDQLRAERQLTDRSLRALLQRDAQTRDQMSEVSGQPALRSLGEAGRSAIRNQQSEISNTSANTYTIQAQADIRQLLDNLEAKKRTLADMLKTQDAQTKTLLTSRDSELKILHERMQEMQRKIMNAAPPEATPEAPPAGEIKTPPAKEAEAADSLTVITSNSVTLRIPIPSP